MKDERKTKKQLIQELDELRREAAESREAEANLGRAEEELQKLAHDLGERVKELSCLYGISALIEEPANSLEEIFQGTIDLVPPAWQYPEITCARLLIDGQEFRTENLRETRWKQANDIMVHDQHIGVLEVYYLEERPEIDEGSFLREERYLINAIAELLGRTIERVRAEEEIKKRNQELVTLNAISSKLNRYTNLDSILKDALQQIVDIARVDGAECHLPDEEGNLTLRKTWGLNDAFVNASQDFHFPVGEGIPGLTFSRREPVYVADSRTDERYWRRDLASAAGYRSLLCVPILGEEVLLGTFMLYSHEHHEFPPEVRELMMTVGALLGGAIRRAQAEAALKLSARVFERATEGILITDAQANIITVNQAFTDITGYEPEDVTGKNPRVLKSGRHSDDFYWRMWESLEGTGQWQGEIWNHRKDGSVYPQWLSISAVHKEDGQITNYIGVFTDITVRKENEDYFQHISTHDPLTDLPNRTLFQDKLTHALALAKRNNRQIAVLFLDLDGFKSVNDTFGHDKGDQVLQKMAEKMKSCIRESDTVARLAGDEFTVILENIANAEEAVEVAGKLLSRLSEPLQFGGIEITLTSSLGISLYPQDGDNVKTLLKHADMAMYRAKQAGKANYQFYTGEGSIEKAVRDEN